MRTIKITKKLRGSDNVFSDAWVCNGYYAIARHLVTNTDKELIELGFEEKDSEGIERAVRAYNESGVNFDIYQSGFTFRDKTVFFGKNNELVAFPSYVVNAFGVERCSFDASEQCGKVFDTGALAILLMPIRAGEDLKKHFPSHAIAY